MRRIRSLALFVVAATLFGCTTATKVITNDVLVTPEAGAPASVDAEDAGLDAADDAAEPGQVVEAGPDATQFVSEDGAVIFGGPDAADAHASDANTYEPPAACIATTYSSAVMMAPSCSIGTVWGCLNAPPSTYAPCTEDSSGVFELAFPDGGILTVGNGGNGVLVCCAQGLAGPP